jgi:hypothetical protein
MAGIDITSTARINYAELGGEVWEWVDEDQAAFLVGFANAFRSGRSYGLLQILHIAKELRKSPQDLDAVRWLNDTLTEYLKEEESK